MERKQRITKLKLRQEQQPPQTIAEPDTLHLVTYIDTENV